MWPFEHHDNGKVYLHNENWTNFKKHKDSGVEYPHNWLHRRLFMLIHSPRNNIKQIPLLADDDLFSWPSIIRPGGGGIISRTPPVVAYRDTINYVSDNWSVIYEPYPAWHRTQYDRDAIDPSFHLWLEDKHPQPTHGEPVVLFSTDNYLNPQENMFALFRGQYWLVENFVDHGLGLNQPSLAEIQSIGTKKKLYRSLDD